MKTTNTQLSDLEDTLDGFEAMSLNVTALKQQLGDVKTIESKLATDEDAVAQLETQCRKLTHAGYIHEPQIYKVLYYQTSSAFGATAVGFSFYHTKRHGNKMHISLFLLSVFTSREVPRI